MKNLTHGGNLMDSKMISRQATERVVKAFLIDKEVFLDRRMPIYNAAKNLVDDVSDLSIEGILKYYKINNYKINSDGTVDINGDVNLREKGLFNIRVKFGKVTGDFICSGNKLTSLQNAPKSVGGDFYCNNNKLTSLQGAPKSVDDSFHCNYNKLTSLQGAPKSVGGSFNCDYNQLINLQGAPKSINLRFYCSYNQLISLQGAPKSIGIDFSCSHNELTSLQNAPESVGGDFYCSDNRKQFTEQDVQAVCKVRGKIYL